MLRKWLSKKPDAQVALRPGGERFAVPKGKTVLEAAIALGIGYPHECTVGTCGRCRSRLISGKVDAITPFGYTLGKEELAAGYILACQAIPKSDLVLEVETDASRTEAEKFDGKIADTEALTHDILRVTWELDRPLSFRAGQYMNVTWPGAPGPRAYSFSTPAVEGGTRRVSTFIRKVPGGAFTEPLFEGRFGGMAFSIEAPHGGFWLRDGDGPILLVAGGSGLSPLMSILEEAVARDCRRDAILLFGGRGERDLYCLDEIAAIGRRWQGRFDFRPVLSEENRDGRRFGLVTGEIPAAIAELGGAHGLQAYLCGPPGMIDAAIEALVSGGTSLADIHYDKFTDASSLSG